MPSTPGTACDTASATQTAPGTGASSSQVCVSVKSKFPVINGVAKDTGITPLNPDGSPNNNFTFTFGNLFLCKALGSANPNLPPVGAFSGAGETACGTFKIAEVGQTPQDLDTCNDQAVESPDDTAADPQPVNLVAHTGGPDAPCAGKPGTAPAPWQDQHDICLDVATDYIPGQTAVNCETGEGGINGTGELPEGLGAFEFQVKFDDKIFQQPTFDCTTGPSGVSGS